MKRIPEYPNHRLPSPGELDQFFAMAEANKLNPGNDRRLSQQLMGRFGLQSPGDVIDFMKTPVGKEIVTRINLDAWRKKALQEELMRQQWLDEIRQHMLLLAALSAKRKGIENYILDRPKDEQKSIKGIEKQIRELDLAIEHYTLSLDVLVTQLGHLNQQLNHVKGQMALIHGKRAAAAQQKQHLQALQAKVLALPQGGSLPDVSNRLKDLAEHIKQLQLLTPFDARDTGLLALPSILEVLPERAIRLNAEFQPVEHDADTTFVLQPQKGLLHQTDKEGEDLDIPVTQQRIGQRLTLSDIQSLLTGLSLRIHVEQTRRIDDEEKVLEEDNRVLEARKVALVDAIQVVETQQSVIQDALTQVLAQRDDLLRQKDELSAQEVAQFSPLRTSPRPQPQASKSDDTDSYAKMMKQFGSLIPTAPKPVSQHHIRQLEKAMEQYYPPRVSEEAKRVVNGLVTPGTPITETQKFRLFNALRRLNNEEAPLPTTLKPSRS